MGCVDSGSGRRRLGAFVENLKIPSNPEDAIAFLAGELLKDIEFAELFQRAAIYAYNRIFLYYSLICITIIRNCLNEASLIHSECVEFNPFVWPFI